MSDDGLDAEYREMAADVVREQEALEWIEHDLGEEHVSRGDPATTRLRR